MALASLKKLWKNEYFQTIVMIVLIIVVVFGFWYGSQLVLNTQYPALAVASGSMCTLPGSGCDGWSHPFERTLHVGDLIIVQYVDPKSIKDTYPESDIIVFHKPKSSPYEEDELIVHRVIEKAERNSLTFFRTKGDGNGVTWPSALVNPKVEGDHWRDYRGDDYTWDGMISEKLYVGKVVMRIPWIGHVALFMRNSSGIILITALIIIVVIIEFIIPVFTKEKAKTKEDEEKTSESQL